MEVADTILQIMAYENTNLDCKKAIGPIRDRLDLTGYMKPFHGQKEAERQAASPAQDILLQSGASSDRNGGADFGDHEDRGYPSR